ncbi:Nose resistant to fluoxetine protein 6 [Sarcoptes scabiei]|nr:Nose resistant to fluoxetine protein 6 [Sarcoptes scabiei]
MVGCYTSILPDLLLGQRTYFESSHFSSLEELTKAFVLFHMGINQYVISFFIGIIIGYLIVQQQINPSRFEWSSRIKLILWSISIVSLSSVMYWFNSLHKINQAPSRTSVLLWFSLGKLIGSFAIGWMILALCIGKADWIERIFSLSLFRFLSRLSFGIYLLHFIPLSHRLFTVRDTYMMTDKVLFEIILIDFIQTCLMASVFYVFIENPFNNFISMIFHKHKTKDCTKQNAIDVPHLDSANNPVEDLERKSRARLTNRETFLQPIHLYSANCGL